MNKNHFAWLLFFAFFFVPAAPVGAQSTAPTCSVSYTPAVILSGGSLSVTWDATTTTSRSYTLARGAGQVFYGPATTTPSGSISVPSFSDFPVGTYQRTDIVTGPGGTSTCSALLTIADVPRLPGIGLVDGMKMATSTPGYSTFGSHNQLMVANGHGIFAVHLVSQEEGTALPSIGNKSVWRLERSTDGGQTYAPLYTSAPVYANSPVIETDEDDNIYLFAVDYGPNAGTVTFMKFPVAANYATFTSSVVAGEAAGKYTAIYDRSRQQFYYLGFNDTPFLVLNKSGAVVSRYQLLKAGTHAHIQYPLFAMDGTRLYVAWTTYPATSSLPQQYYDIHFMYSDNGGQSWSVPGQSTLALPVVSDDTGPTPEITPAEYVGATSTWLANFAVVDGTAHFMFSAGGRMVYRRYSMEPFTLLSSMLDPWSGATLRLYSLHAIFTRINGTQVLYAAGTDSAGHVVVLKTTDQGATWHDYGRSDTILSSAYALVGPRVIYAGSTLPSLVTNITTQNAVPLNGNELYSFRIQAAETPSIAPTPAPTCTLSYAPASVVYGQPLKIMWDATNAASRSSTITNSAGQVTVGPASTTVIGVYATSTFNQGVPGTFTRKDIVVGPSGTSTCQAVYTVIAPPPPPPLPMLSCSISYSPTSVAQGQNLTITWPSQSATSRSYVVKTSNGATIFTSGAIATSGVVSLTPYNEGTAPGAYTRVDTVVGPGGVSTCQAVLTILPPAPSCPIAGPTGTSTCQGGNTVTASPPPPPPPPTCSLSYSPTSVAQGQNLTITWPSQNATSRSYVVKTANGATIFTSGAIATSGVISLTPYSEGTSPGAYTRVDTVVGPGGISTCQGVLTILPPLPVCSISYNPASISKNSLGTLGISWDGRDITSRFFKAFDALGNLLFTSGSIPAVGSVQDTSYRSLTPGSYARMDTVGGPGGTSTCQAVLNILP